MVRLEGREAKEFIEQDKKPLTEKDIKHLKGCLEIYKNNPIKEMIK